MCADDRARWNRIHGSDVRQRMKLLGVVVIAIGCSACAAHPTTDRADSSPSSVHSSPPTTERPIETDQAGTNTPCTGFEPKYIGSGLTVSLASDATRTTSGGTADVDPIQAAAGVEFELNDGLISIGRNLGSDTWSEPNFATRADGDVVI